MDIKLKEAVRKQRENERNINSSVRNLNKVLTFYIQGQVYGVEISNVTEIIGIQPFTHVPGTPKFVKGIINVRSKVVPVIEVRTKFGKDEVSYTDRTSIIIVNLNEFTVGLIVDRVAGVHDVYEDTISDTPDSKQVNSSKYIKYLIRQDDEVRLILDLDKFINE